MHKSENKSLWEEEMSCSDTWYICFVWVEYFELKKYACIWLISICKIRPSNELF